MNFDILGLGVIQGVSEILPISSSVNLYLFSKIFAISEFSFSLKIALHAGSLITLLIYFKREIADILKAIFGKRSLSDTYFWPLFLGTIPVVIFGFFARDFVKEFESPKIMGIFCIIFGIALTLFDKLSAKSRPGKQQLSKAKALIIGCCQTISIFPGVSRLGICITASRMLAIDRKSAINFSLMLAIPSICGSLFLEIVECFKTSSFALFSNDSLFGIFLTAIVGLITIIPCIRFMEKQGFLAIAVYRIIIGIAIFLI